MSMCLSSTVTNKNLITHNKQFHILVWAAVLPQTNKKNLTQMVSVYSSDTRLQEGNRFPHPVTVHELPSYQADELFPHWGATVAFTLISCSTAYTVQLTPSGWHAKILTMSSSKQQKNYFTHKIKTLSYNFLAARRRGTYETVSKQLFPSLQTRNICCQYWISSFKQLTKTIKLFLQPDA